MIDTLKVAKWLRDAGFTEPQAEAVVAAVQETEAGADLATKRDLAETHSSLKAEIAAVRTELKAEIAEARTELKAEIAEARAELKAEIIEVRTELKVEITAVRTELKTDIAEVRSDLRNAEHRFEAKLEVVKSDILSRVFTMILGAVVINIVAIVGAIFGVAKLLGH
jgi:DNA-binding transcriptional MerR regulator